MVFILIVGIVLGVSSVIFAMDNAALVTVTLFTWQITTPLALIILAAMVFGIFITLLSMVPAAIQQALERYAERREKIRLQQQLRTQEVIAEEIKL